MTTLAFAEIAPERYGGPGNIRIKAEEEAMRTGRPFAEAVLSLMFSPTGKVHHFPGLPPMTDYELHPQAFPLPTEFVAHVFPRMNEAVEACDGVFFNSPTSYEPEAFERAKAWLNDIGNVGYACGPLLHRRWEAASVETRLSQNETEVIRFLDNTLNDSGERSLLYISFGSFFGPANSLEKLWAFLDVVMELGIPFLLSLASPSLGPFPTEVVDKLIAHGKGSLIQWAPQQIVLEHPATGWFVTHGGQNSVIESISAGVPMIVWPFHADQPLNAVRISEVLEVGYELIEVRTGHGTHPLHRNGRKPVGTIEALEAELKDVLTKAFGEDGAQKRKNLLPLSSAFTHEWEQGGASHRDVRAFLDTL
ncbi:glycosyltransferase family 1 protein [Trametes sanguinea]|nr:glycosyltransferase family 1 protein [Trametes sanguinea]